MRRKSGTKVKLLELEGKLITEILAIRDAERLGCWEGRGRG